ncbi:multidrug resistance-associated protein 1 [Lingula anatina]|uniref:ABC-type glutathione-S-conjugate transporter n=1 Tax=Lingula anatina TaxID=7574 RepID=A0A1S3HVB9_LINAN|nr:multidrug resistance-associated protein 1 [Lingula anatina]|eukprot:XP_013389987.1 multidrug resistance-associated protein 1 [Lingula anatina]
MEEIYWTDICGNSSQYSPFWSPSLTVNTSNPDFTQCFQDTVLVWVPCGFLWIYALYYIPSLRKEPVVHKLSHGGKLQMSKLILSILLCLTVLVDFFKTLGDIATNPAPVFYMTPLIYFVSFALSTFLISYEFVKGVASSAILFLFWLLLLITGVITFRSQILQLENVENVSVFRAVTTFVYFTFVLLEFILHIWADKRALPGSLASEYQPLLGAELEKEDILDEKAMCQELTASYVSRMLFWWITRLVIKGYKRPLVFSDLTKLKPSDSCRSIVPSFLRQWNKQVIRNNSSPALQFSISHKIHKATYDNNKTNESYQNAYQEEVPYVKMVNSGRRHKGEPSFTKAMLWSFGGYYAWAGLLKLVYEIVMFVNPVLLSYFISFIESDDPFIWRGYLLAVVMFMTSLLKAFLNQHQYYMSQVVGLRMRTAAITALYRKSLRLSNESRKNSTVGQIVNLMSVDAQKLQEAPFFLHMIWSCPLSIIISVALVWQYLGPATLAGVMVILLMLPVNFYFGNKIRYNQVLQMGKKDIRIKCLNEILNGIKVLKLYGWETSFEEKTTAIRKTELRYMRNASLSLAMCDISYFSVPLLTALTSFATFVLSDPNNVLDPNTAFVSLALFTIMNEHLGFLPYALMFLIQAGIAMRRIGRFMKMSELDLDTVDRRNNGGHPISLENASFAWEEGTPTLKNLNFQLEQGELVAVVGQVGSGKSSLISALLGEMVRTDGYVRIQGSMAYVPQQAWIQNLTLKNNILFGKELNQTFYRRCISCCALEPDLKMLPGGDQIEIGEKGINLSGGQKQRVSMARAVYQDCDVYLLDDPLSAVDSHVGKHLFDKVIGPEGMLQCKTRILCTNSISCLSKVDKIIVLNKGEISEIGTYQELLSHNGGFAEFIKTYLSEQDEQSEDEDEETTEIKNQLRQQILMLSGSIKESEKEVSKGHDTSLKVKRRRFSERSEESEVIHHEVETGEKLIEEEYAAVGRVRWGVIRAYVKAAGKLYTSCLLTCYSGYVVMLILTNIWLNIWTNDAAALNGTQSRELTDLRLGVYGGLGATQMAFVAVEYVAIVLGTLQAARVLHRNFLQRIMKAPMHFFDTTPIGRIINRFSKDMDTCDINIPLTLVWFAGALAFVFTTLVVIIYSTPTFILVAIPLIIIYLIIQTFYLYTARQLQRIDALKRSPIYSHFSETLVGVSSIRAYKQQDRFIRTTDRMVDDNQIAYYPNIVSNRWLGICLEVLGSSVILFAAIFALIARESEGGISGGEVGLSVSFSLQMTEQLNFVVKTMCDFEMQIVSIERIKEYSEVEIEVGWILEVFIGQDPVLFSGSLRMNLDPFDQYSDNDIWNALEHSHLNGFVRSLPEGLQYECNEGGENLSVGQRQLVCLARALLRKTKILVLDEATAAVDMETDDLIQTTVRNEFKDSTILTIAHRLNTIMDYTRVLVLDHGEIKEFDSPTDLLANKRSIFFGMAKDAGLV